MLIVMIYAIGITAGYIVIEKDAIICDQIMEFSSFVTQVYCVIICASFIMRKEEYLGMIDIISGEMDKREKEYHRPIYKEIRKEVESITTTVLIYMHGVVVGLLLIPTMILSYTNYYLLHKGASSFVGTVPSA